MDKATKREAKNNKNENKFEFYIDQGAVYSIKKVVEESDEAFNGMNLLRKEGERLLNVSPEIKQGNLFEIIEKTKFNMDAALKGSNIRAYTTAENGFPHDKADILIKKGGEVIEEVQAKSGNKASTVLHRISDNKYEGMQKLVNSDKVDKARELAQKRVESGSLKMGEYKDSLKNLTGELKFGDIESGGTGYDEVLGAAENYKEYARNFEVEQIKNEVMASVAAVSIIKGGISVIKNSIAFNKSEIDGKQMVGNIMIDTGKAATRGAATGGVRTGIRMVAIKSGNGMLAKSNIATSMATGVIDVGITVVDYARGEIDSEQAMIQIGQKGFNTMSSVYAGAAAGAVFGPGGMLIGSMVGYMVAADVYQTCVDIIKNEELKEEEVNRLINLYQEAIEVMKTEREALEIHFKAQICQNRAVFSRIQNALDKSIQENDVDLTIRSLSELACYFGKELKLMSFEDFDRSMKSDVVIII